jgi:hypothetical protein
MWTVLLKVVVPASTVHETFSRLGDHVETLEGVAYKLQAYDAEPEDLKLYQEWSKS